MPLFAYVDPPDVTIIPEYFGTRNHIPRETAIVTQSKPITFVENNESCLPNCSGEAVSDEQRLKNVSWEDAIRN